MSFNNTHLADKLAEFVRQLSSDPTVLTGAQVEIVANIKLPGTASVQPASVLLQTINVNDLTDGEISSILSSPPGSTAADITGLSTQSPTSWKSPSIFSQTKKQCLASSSRKRRRHDLNSTQESVTAMDKLVQSIWTQILDLSNLATESELNLLTSTVLKGAKKSTDTAGTSLDFLDPTSIRLPITTSTRTTRAVEVLVQTDWMRRYLKRRDNIKQTRPGMKQHEANKLVLAQAGKAFSWTEKELRNHISIWKGYLELQETAGWAALVFAGPGLYKFCKYRAAFDQPALDKLGLLRTRFEVAADTLQPQWRKLLALVGEDTQAKFTGHPHDWSVSIVNGTDPPLPLAVTYHQWDPNFTFQHLEESIIDRSKWPDKDPRIIDPGPTFTCQSCGLPQFSHSNHHADQNQNSNSNSDISPHCTCFPTLFSPHTSLTNLPPAPVQIFRTPTGKNNGLIALLPLPPSTAIAQFLGQITHSLTHTDVMQPLKPRCHFAAPNSNSDNLHNNNLLNDNDNFTNSEAFDDEPPYQIWQGQHGNLTRFINHSCAPNSEFRVFTWLGVQRVLVVTGARGVDMGEEVTVDYSAGYWEGLDKVCLCGEEGCRYRYRSREVSSRSG